MAEGEGGPAKWADLAFWPKFAAVVVILAVLAAAGGIAYAIYNGTTPTFKNPNFVDAILESRLVMAGVRIAIIGASVYVLVSVIGLISRGQWLSSVGPFKVAEAVRRTEEDSSDLRDQLRKAEEVIDNLKVQLDRTEKAIEVSNRDRDEVIKELSQTRRELERAREGKSG